MYQQYAQQAAQQHNIPIGIFSAVINAESGWNPSAVSPAGAIGLGQLMPRTAESLGVDPWNPRQNLEGAARYLSQQYQRFGSWEKALSAYNAGPGNVERYGGIPPFKETQAYVRKILGSSEATHSPSRATRGVMNGGAYPDHQDARRAALRSVAFQDTPGLQAALASQDAVAQQQPATQHNPRAIQYGQGQTGKFKVLPRRPNEHGYQYLQRLGAYGGLRNDPGTGQTTGGTHATGSPHYDWRAVDYGDALNGQALLNQWANFLNKNFDTLGLERVIWQQPGHYNHVDAATAWGGR